MQSLRPRLPRGAGERRDRHGGARPPREDRLRFRRSRWATAPASPAANACRPAPPARSCRRRVLDAQQCLCPRARPRGRQRLSLLRRRLPDHLQDQGRQAPLCRRQATGPSNHATGSASRAASASTMSIIPHRLTVPLIRKDGVAKRCRRRGRSGQSLDAFPRGELGRGARRARPAGLKRIRDTAWRQGARRLRLRQGLERGGLSLPEAGAHRLRHQQCRSLHAALPRLLGRGADGGDRLGRGYRALHRRARTPTSSSSSAPTRPRTIPSPPPSSRTR